MGRSRAHAPTRLGGLLVSEEAVYGLVLVAGMIIVASEVGTHLWETMITVATTVLVFFAAHVYAGTLSRMASVRRHPVPRALRSAARHSVGLLLVCMPPLLVLAAGALGLLSPRTAIWTALIVTVILLVVDGWLMATARTGSLWGRVLGGAVSGVFGIVLILLKALIHQ